MNQIAVTEHDHEPYPGLPKRLPEGEYVLWQGRPEARLVARRVLKTRWVAGYMLLLAAWAAIAGVQDSRSIAAIAFSSGVLLLMGAVLVALLEGYAWASARCTLYTVTNRRVVLRIGVGMTVTINLPFAEIGTLAVKSEKDGTGNIAFALKDPETRLAWFILWPHARAWRLAKPEPAMICVADAAGLARTIADEMQGAHGADNWKATGKSQRAGRPVRVIAAARESATVN